MMMMGCLWCLGGGDSGRMNVADSIEKHSIDGLLKVEHLFISRHMAMANRPMVTGGKGQQQSTLFVVGIFPTSWKHFIRSTVVIHVSHQTDNKCSEAR